MFRVQQRVRGLHGRRVLHDTRKRPVAIAVLQRDRVDRRLVGHLEQLEQHPRLEVGHVPGRDEREIGRRREQPGVQARERPSPSVGSRANVTAMPGGIDGSGASGARTTTIRSQTSPSRSTA